MIVYTIPFLRFISSAHARKIREFPCGGGCGAKLRRDMEAALGQRVVRGPDWEWGDQDGGEGFVGTVAGVEEGGGGVIVQWDMGQRCRYRCGKDNKFDLSVLDCAQIGTSHQHLVKCSSCSQEVWGFLWRCVHCFEGGGLCNSCYMAGKHSPFHSFVRIDTDGGPRVKVQPRKVLHGVQACGIYPGAVVVRGNDWKPAWKDQDGGSGNLGDVIEIRNWKNESFRSTVQVMWSGGNKPNVYRLGLKGKFIGTTGVVQHITDSGRSDCQLPRPGHLPRQPSAVTKVEGVAVYRVGDAVRVNEDKDQVAREQKGHGGWREEMAEVDVKVKDKTGLLVATAEGWPEVVKLLLDFKANVNEPEQDGNTALHVAVAAHRSEAVRTLLEAGASPTVYNKAHLTPILAAATTGFYLGLEQLIGSHPDEVKSQRDEDGNGALHLAAANNHLDLVCLLAEKEACDVNAANKTKRQTALHVAAVDGHTRIVEHLLVHCEANPDATDVDGHTPLQLISRELHQSRPSPENYMSTGCLLAKYGATFDKENLTNDFGCSTYFVTLLVSYSEKRSRS
ncbi:E3 ubiquitin-protein ligase mind-bomb [Geodia barretti]|uniref:E3 ubiquitin-protein ligase mind-bomb n=1 Tax=Geodia barretti TaxID=519541 RepID=A0AA35SRN3_GEOBA|nr:E3 ubiquitin-protein ligase mind-bomb [Geodia barretti]